MSGMCRRPRPALPLHAQGQVSASTPRRPARKSHCSDLPCRWRCHEVTVGSFRYLVRARPEPPSACGISPRCERGERGKWPPPSTRRSPRGGEWRGRAVGGRRGGSPLCLRHLPPPSGGRGVGTTRRSLGAGRVARSPLLRRLQAAPGPPTAAASPPAEHIECSTESDPDPDSADHSMWSAGGEGKWGLRAGLRGGSGEGGVRGGGAMLG